MIHCCYECTVMFIFVIYHVIIVLLASLLKIKLNQKRKQYWVGVITLIIHYVSCETRLVIVPQCLFAKAQPVIETVYFEVCLISET